MIVYFSGTGNSRSVAEKLARDGERVEEISAITEDVLEDERIGIVFPVYCADVPRAVAEFLKRVKLVSPYIFSVATQRGVSARSAGRGTRVCRDRHNARQLYSVRDARQDQSAPSRGRRRTSGGDSERSYRTQTHPGETVCAIRGGNAVYVEVFQGGIRARSQEGRRLLRGLRLMRGGLPREQYRNA